MNRTWLVPVLAAAGMSCGDTTTPLVNQLNLDRPVDMSFACFGPLRLTGGRTTANPGDTVTTSPQPISSCEIRSPAVTPTAAGGGTLPVPVPPGQEGLDTAPSWFGFILQSAAGTVALSTWPTGPAQTLAPADVKVLDADPLTPGSNAISVGEEPIAIATDKAGCFEVTANAGSCDLSTLDIASAVDRDPATPVVVKRLDVTYVDATNTKVPLRARPAAMVSEPATTVIGNACPVTATGLLYIAYPSCDLVAGVDAATGEIKTGIKLTRAADGKLTSAVLTADGLKNLSCPNECAGTGPTAPLPATARPVALDLLSYTDGGAAKARLVIGAGKASSLTIVDLDPATSLPLPAPLVIGLEDPDKRLGVTAVSLSPVIAMGGSLKGLELVNDGSAGDGQYVYAVATDGTIRVVDVLSVNKECDTQVDPRLVRTLNLPSRSLQCFPVGDPATPKRRVGARGPGIQIPGDTIPTSVAIVHGLGGLPPSSDPMNPVTASPTILLGYFAIVTTSSGSTYVVNVDNDSDPDAFDKLHPISTAPALVMAHQLRDSFESRDAIATKQVPDVDNPSATKAVPVCTGTDPQEDEGGTAGGGPRLASPPAQRLPNGITGTIPASKGLELPQVQQVRCVGSDTTDAGIPVSVLDYGASGTVRDLAHPDLGGVRTEPWTLTWEGLLSQDSASNTVDGPQIRVGQMLIDGVNGMSIVDQTRPFCEMGVEPFDIVQFRGCNPANSSADCPSGYECYLHPDRRIDSVGVCMPAGQGSRLASPCRDFLITRQRYSVRRPDPGKLVLLPRKHELTTTPIDGCVSNEQCQGAADLALQIVSDRQPVELQDPTTGVHDGRTWSCEADDLRPPVNSDPARNKRCVQKCAFHSADQKDPHYDGKDRDIDCEIGTVCAYATPGAAVPDGTCMESVQPPQACVVGPQHYDVRANEAFTVIGLQSGYVHPIIEKGGQCVRNPDASPLQIGRIPLKAPACNTAADPYSGQVSPGVFEANPCSTTVPQVELQPNYDPASASCALKAGQATTVLTARADTPAIKFRNAAMTLTMVDPYWPGDKSCIRDRQGTLGQIPLVVPGYQLVLDQRAGFTPLVLTSIAPAFPVKVVRGPSDSFWVIDDGDFLSTTIGVSSTRGLVFRVEPQDLGASKTLQ